MHSSHPQADRAKLPPRAIPAALSAAAFLSAGAAAYAAFYPPSQLFGPVLVAPRTPSQIALTYDDGPNPAATPQLLDVLARHNVRATFFLVGRFVQREPQLARRIAAAGHLIGNHTLTHPCLAWQSRARIREELAATNAILEDTLGSPVRFFRPPFGARRPFVLHTARSLGLTTVQWNVTAFDWEQKAGDQISSHAILAHLQTGIARNLRRHRASNLLLHDGGHLGLNQPRRNTVQATDRLLTALLLPTLSVPGRPSFVTPEAWL